jgi:serine/threonine-protein kinase
MTSPCPRCGAARASAGPCPDCLLRVALKKPSAPDLQGETLGDRYKVGKVIGEGGMGWVYEAFDTQLEQKVALKILAEDLDQRAALLREARLTALLRHEHIVRVLDVGEHEGISYLTMDLIDGGSLEGLIADPDRVAAVVRDIARAVEHAHDEAVLHRDLKPQNVLVDAKGRVFVTDFGIATRLDLAAGATLEIGGTPQYMAPEVLRGERGAVSRAADIWAMGAILHELCTGQAPFDARSYEALLKKLDEPPPPLDGVPADLAAIAFKCLERDPARRYPSAKELADDLQRFLDDEPPKARPLGPAARAVQLAVRRPFAVALGALFAFAVAWVVVAALSLAHAQQTAYRVADYAARRAADVTAMQVAQLAELVEAAARDPAVQRATAGGPSDEAARVCQDLFARHAAKPFDGWFLFDRQGLMISRAPGVARDNRGLSFGFRDYFRGAAQRGAEKKRAAYVSRAFHSEGDGSYEVALAVPVFDAAGEWIGVLGGAVPTGAALATLDDAMDDRLSAAVIAPRDRERDRDAFDTDPIFLLHRALHARGEQLPASGGLLPATGALMRVAEVRGTPFRVAVSYSYDGSLPARLGQIEILVAWIPVVVLVAAAGVAVRWARARRRPVTARASPSLRASTARA